MKHAKKQLKMSQNRTEKPPSQRCEQRFSSHF